MFDLQSFKNVDFYSFSITHDRQGWIGANFINISNPAYLDEANFLTDEEIAQLEIDSRVNNFDLTQSLTYQTSNFLYTDQYGVIGTHNPEEFFTRLFINKYEQNPSPAQRARGIEFLNTSGFSQQQFLDHFAAIENDVMTVGSFNYSGIDMSIPNVPLDITAFGETALVYGALIGQAPTKAEVAKLTLTPEFTVRPLADRARLILEMPAYAGRYGLAMPEVDFVNLGNGEELNASTAGQTIRIDAVSLGADNLAGTADDGNVRAMEIYFNGILKEDDMSNLDDLGLFYEYDVPSDLATGEYLVEVVAEDANGLRSRAERSIYVRGTDDANISITGPAIGELLYGDQVVDFEYNATESVTAYLEVDGKIHWNGRLAFDESNLSADESTVTIYDGTGRGAVVFEFDNNGSASATTIDAAEGMSVSGAGTLTSIGTYLGTTAREYLIEIDSNGTTDTFRWSVDGGANFNESMVSIPAGLSYSLSAGVTITFADQTSYLKGDRWRIKAYPDNEIVVVERYGDFAERLAGTKENLIRAINRASNQGKLAIRAEDLYITGNSLGGFPEGAPTQYAIDLVHDGSYPILNDVNLTASATSTLATAEYFPEVTTTSGTTGTLSLDLRKREDLTGSVISVRVVGIADADNNVSYSRYHHYELRDSDRLYAELIEPTGRSAVVRITEVDGTGAITEVEIVDGGVGYDDRSWNYSILSFEGSGADLNATLDENGTLTDLNITSGGTGYALGDVILPKAPTVYEVGQNITLRARVNDPHGELSRVAFYANGEEIPGTPTEFGNERILTFSPTSEHIEFLSVRALYGDGRDFPLRLEVPCPWPGKLGLGTQLGKPALLSNRVPMPTLVLG